MAFIQHLIRMHSSFLTRFQSRQEAHLLRNATVLLIFQASLSLLLVLTLVLICFVNTGPRLVFYVTLVAILMLVMVASLHFNVKGKYKISAWLAIADITLGPWASLMLDGLVYRGDFVPLIYIVLSIQLCAVLMSERKTIAVALFQTLALTAFILSSPYLQAINWPSLFAFIFFSAALGVITSFVNRKQLEQIQRQNKILKENEAQWMVLSSRDPLTGLFNRRHMEETLDLEVDKARREGKSLGLIMADLDGFKKINDTFGHDAGDAVLRKVATLLKKELGSAGIACRFGGDEFMLILPESTLAQTQSRAQALHADFRQLSFDYEGRLFDDISLSLGAAALPDSGASTRELIKAADMALYESKRREREMRSA